MRKVVVVLVVLIVLALSLGTFAFQNEPDGFRGLNWGDPPSKDMKLLGEVRNRANVYELPDDKMFLGSVPLFLVGYIFYEDRFMTGLMYFKGKDNYDLLESICKQRYGEDADVGFYTIQWIDQKSFIFLKYDYADEEGSLSISSTSIMGEAEKAEKKEEAEKAEGDW